MAFSCNTLFWCNIVFCLPRGVIFPMCPRLRQECLKCRFLCTLSLSPFFYLSLTLFFLGINSISQCEMPLKILTSVHEWDHEVAASWFCRPACVCVLSVARACCQVASTSLAPFQIATLPFLPSLGLCSSTWHNFWEPPEDWMGRENAGKDDVGQNLQVVHQSSSPWATDCPPLYILGRQLRRWQFYFSARQVLTMLSLFCFPIP